MIHKNENDRYFLAQAYEYAKLHSSDPRTQNGAVIVDPVSSTIISKGTNRFPDKIRNTPERLLPENKRDYLEHAERDAIFSALRQGKSTVGMTLYVPWFACADCAKAIIGAGITSVVGHHAPCSVNTLWSDTIKIGLTLLTEAGVAYSYYDGEIGVENMRFGGETINR